MSKFSGKCDLYDWIEIAGGYQEFMDCGYTIYVGKSEEPLKIESLKDLVPYYPYVISSVAGGILHLSSRSWVDMEEERCLNNYLSAIIKNFNRCKRKKIEFDVDAAVKEVFLYCHENEIRELANRVKEYGKKATVEGLHLSSYEHYREFLENEIQKFNDYDVTVYNKLVRDNMFQILKDNGNIPKGYTICNSSFTSLLYSKLKNEVNDFVEEKNEEKYEERIADILEVLDAFVKEKDLEWEKIKKIKEKKKNIKGGYDKRLYLEQILVKKEIKDEKEADKKES